MPPVNDDFANATDLDPAGGSVAGTTVAATSETDEPTWDGSMGVLIRNSGAFTFQSVWYKLTALADGAWEVDEGATAAGLDIVVYRGTTLADLEMVANNANTNIRFAVFAGQTVYIQLYSYVAGTPPGEAVTAAQPFSLSWFPTPCLRLDTKVDGAPYGRFLYGGRFPSGDALPADHIRDMWFGSFFSGTPVDRQFRNIKIGTTGYGSSDLFAPALASTAEFDSIQGSSGDLTVSGGVLSVANSGADVFAVKDLGADLTYPLYVQFDFKISADEAAGYTPEMHAVAFGDPADFEDDWIDSVYAFAGSGWGLDGGMAEDGAMSYGSDPPADTWITLDFRWDFGGESPPAPVSAVLRLGDPPLWRFIVTNLAGETLTVLDTRCSERGMVFALNQPATLTGLVPSDDPEINIPSPTGTSPAYLSHNTRLIYGLRREIRPSPGDDPWHPRISTLVMGVEDVAADAPTSRFTGYDPWQYMMCRPIRTNYGELAPQGGIIYEDARASDMALDLLVNTALVDGETLIDFTDLGLIEDTIVIPGKTVFERGISVGEAWQQLTDTGTIDIVLRPIYDPVSRPGILCELIIAKQAGQIRYNAVMGWDRASRSLTDLSRLIDGTRLANEVQFFAGQGGTPVDLQADAVSVAKYGEYWAQQFMVGKQTQAPLVELLALAQLQIRKNGATSIAFSPPPERSYLSLRDYGLGDYVPVWASRQFREPLGVDYDSFDAAAPGASGYQRLYAIPIENNNTGFDRPGLLVSSQDTSNAF